MAATVSIRVCTGANYAAVSNTVTGIDLISADNSTNSAANRAAFPITAGAKSYEKVVVLYVDAPADNAINNINLYGDGSVQSSTHLYVGKTSAAGTPTSGDSGIATNAWTDYTSGAVFAWHATSMTGAGSTTDYALLQLDCDNDCAAGNWTQEVCTYTFDEW